MSDIELRPVYDMLKSASRRVSGHMPSHKGISPFGSCKEMYSLDTTELMVTDDLYMPERGIREAENLYSQAVNSGKTIFLHNGSTCGIHTMIQMYCHEGDKILLPRNAHLSAVNACIIGGVDIEWIPFTILPDGYPTVCENTIIQSMISHPECKAVLVTRPDYYGGMVPLDNISRLANKMSMKLIVDEAHGAHLPWLEKAMENCGMKPIQSSGKYGADAWVQSVHKVLPGLTGSAVLNLKNPGDYSSALDVLRREMTSSPSFLLMMSIDDSRAWMEKTGIDNMTRLLENCAEFKSSLDGFGCKNAVSDWEKCSSLLFDPTRIVIAAPQGGKIFAEQLSDMGIDVEMWDTFRVVIITSPIDPDGIFVQLKNALEQINIPSKRSISCPDYTCAIPEKKITVRKACMGKSCLIPLENASGAVAAKSAGLYPPGIPLICPGEVYNDDIICRLKAAGEQNRFGVNTDNTVSAVL